MDTQDTIADTQNVIDLLVAEGFDAAWYETTYRDEIARHGLEGESPLDFYRRLGGFLGHDPHDGFSEILYRKKNTDVRKNLTQASGETGFRHWLEFGVNETGRHPFTKSQINLARQTYLALDRRFLEKTYGARMAGYPTVVDYYFSQVTQEELSPSAEFSESGYRDLYEDVTIAIGENLIASGFQHFLLVQTKEVRHVISHDQYLKSLAEKKSAEQEAETRLALEDNLPGVTALAALDMLNAMEFYGRKVKVRRTEAQGPGGLLVLVPDFLPEILFGGYLAFYGFLRKLSEQTGIGLRLMVINHSSMEKHEGNLLRMRIKMPKIYNMFHGFQKFDAQTRAVEIPANYHVISYCAELHRIAQKIAASANQKPIFFIQEYEPDFHANTDMRSFNESAFFLPHDAVYNSHKLIEFFQKKTPVFERAGKDYRYTAIENQLVRLNVGKDRFVEMNSGRETRRFIMYGRPEGHAARNHFGMLVYALREAIRQGVFAGEDWEFYALGTLGKIDDIDLGGSEKLRMVPKMPKEDYEEFLLTGDIGLSVITTPHPGIVHFQMAAYGLPTVTNKTDLRNDAWLAKQNRNLIPVEMSPETLVEGFRVAVERAKDLNTRYDNAIASPVMDEESCLRNALADLAAIVTK